MKDARRSEMKKRERKKENESERKTGKMKEESSREVEGVCECFDVLMSAM